MHQEWGGSSSGEMNSTRKSHDSWSRTSQTRVIRRAMFAAASDTAVGRVVDYSIFTFDVTSAYTHAWEDELVFLEPPPEEIEEHGDCVWDLRTSQRCKVLAGAEARKHGSEVSSKVPDTLLRA